jgi:hypothetical protein
MRTVNSGSFDKSLSVSIECLNYVVSDEININVIRFQEVCGIVLETMKSRT